MSTTNRENLPEVALLPAQNPENSVPTASNTALPSKSVANPESEVTTTGLLLSLFFGLLLFVHVIMEQVTVGLGVLYPKVVRKLWWMLHPINGFVILTIIILLAASYAMTQHYPDSNRRVTLAQRLSIFSKTLMGITVVLAFITQIPALKSGFERASSTTTPVTAIIRIPGSSNQPTTAPAAIPDHTDITIATSTSTTKAQIQRKEDQEVAKLYMEQVHVMFDRQLEVFDRHFEALGRQFEDFGRQFEVFGWQMDMFQASFSEGRRRMDRLEELLTNLTNPQAKV
ncbi:MAG: hypothetical protein LQ347_004657 [Umbilicaria vellea]|nr:MAG: hypothetical protein LQ347_004657 [Umbilicaria vellea]